MRKFFWTLAVCLFSASAWSATNAEDASGSQLYMAGDSIMTEYTPDWFPQYGWGQSLKSFMKKPENLHNFAQSGWSAVEAVPNHSKRVCAAISRQIGIINMLNFVTNPAMQLCQFRDKAIDGQDKI